MFLYRCIPVCVCAHVHVCLFNGMWEWIWQSVYLPGNVPASHLWLLKHPKFPESLLCFYPLWRCYFSSFLRYNMEVRCQVKSPAVRKLLFSSHPVVLPVGFCAKAGWEPSSCSFLFNLAYTVFLVNHCTSLDMSPYWSCVLTQKLTQA